jgi:peptide/nickel transport system substrate-binding protein
MVDVNSVEAKDDHTVVFNMAKADVSFVARLGWYGTFILPKHVFDNGQSWDQNVASTTTPVGSGPFKFEEYKQGESVTLTANKDYHDGAPKLDKVKFSIIPDDATAVQALLNGEVDSIDAVPDAYVDQLKADAKFRLDLNEYPSPVRIIFNLKNEKVGDKAVRQAIAYCIDRESISDKVYGGTMPPEYSAYPSMIEWASNTTDTYPKANIQKAIETLEAAGYKKDANGYYVSGLTLDVFDSMNCPDTAKLIASACKEAGIEINVQVSEYNAWSQKVGKDRNFIIEMQGGFMGPDPSALRDRIGSNQASNYGFYSNAQVDDYLAKAVATGEQDERAKNFKAAQKILVDELPYINIVAYAQYEGANAKVKNLPIDGTGKWGWQEYTFTYFEK